MCNILACVMKIRLNLGFLVPNNSNHTVTYSLLTQHCSFLVYSSCFAVTFVSADCALTE